MKVIEGTKTSATIYTDKIENSALKQLKELVKQDFMEGQKVAVMPDVHAGMGCTVGTTMTIGDAICPNLVGVDIGCGMLVVNLRDAEIDLEKLDKVIKKNIPYSFSIRKTPHPFNANIDLDDLICREMINLERARLSIGTLGGGNHFIEVNKDSLGDKWLVIHSGSRNMGHQIATYWQKKAIETRPSDKIRKDLAYLVGDLAKAYLHDMELAQRYAKINREAMLAVIARGMGFDTDYDIKFHTVHNYIDHEAGILRKGAVSAEDGETLLIPMNMRDGSLLCEGKGNRDWNFSAPHGAGRTMSRTQARATFKTEDFVKEMEGIFTTTANQKTLDECPMAYKPMSDITDYIEPTVKVIDVLKPIYNFKAEEQKEHNEQFFSSIKKSTHRQKRANGVY